MGSASVATRLLWIALVAASSLAAPLSFLGSSIAWRERAAAARFGPGGFASAAYGLRVLEPGVAPSDETLHRGDEVVVASALLRPSIDVARPPEPAADEV